MSLASASLLVTGGTGSFGIAFVKTVLACPPHPSRLAILSRDEVKQAAMAARHVSPALRFFLGDVRDYSRLVEAFQGCETVIHAAALKRVDQGCYNPDELLKTNVLGTRNVLRAAVNAGVGRVLVLSSDKAVEPHNVYGVTKAMAEALAVNWNAYSYPQGTRIACLRYGNVAASRGSVVELWRTQREAGIPLTMTNPAMTRFWLTLPEAVAYALKALGTMQGGEIFVPILPSLRLGDLAEAVAPGHPITVTGRRPGGEKDHELLLNSEEVGRTVQVNGWYAVAPAIQSWRAPPLAGVPLKDDFCYRSDLNPWRLTVEAMRGLLKAVP